MNRMELIALILVGLLVVIVISVLVIKRKDFYAHLPGLITFPPTDKLASHTLEINAPLGVPNTNDNLERYSLDNIPKAGVPSSFSQAYLEPPNLLELPPAKKLTPASKQRLHAVSGIPEGMYQGSDYMFSEYTPDYLTCKSGVI